MGLFNLLRPRLNISMLIALLIILTMTFYSVLALNSFYTYKKIVNPTLELTLDRFHFFLKNELKKEYINITTPKALNDDESPLKTFRITVKQTDIDGLSEDLPISGKDHYVDAYMSASDKKDAIYKVKMRYRGDNTFHWMYAQKSLRLKLAKNDVYNMAKSFNLINPPMFLQIRDMISYQIASDLGLITPEYYPVRVFINGAYMGTYIYLSQVDESLLRKHKLMPGSIYYGEAAPINENGIFDLCFNEKYWQKKAARNAEQKENRDDIQYFIEATNDMNHMQFFDFVNTMINKEKYFSYIALDRFTGSPHHDFGHNLKLYFDPYKGKFEPIEWDIRFWTDSELKDESLYQFILKASENPIFDAEIDRILYKMLNEYPISLLEKKYSSILNKVEKDVKADMYKDTATWLPKLFSNPPWYSLAFSFDDLTDQFHNDIKKIDKRLSNLHKIINNTKIKYYLEKNHIYFEVSGNSPIKLIFPREYNLTVFKIFREEEYKVNNNEILYPGKELIQNGQTKYPIAFHGRDKVGSANLVYEFVINKQELIDSFVTHIRYINDITGKNVIPEKSNINFKQNHTIIHPWIFTKPAQNKIFEGPIHVNKTIVFNKNTTVIIKPNTTFIMDENTSIYFYGKVSAIGTKEKPIKFIAKDPNKPWGLVAVQGKAASGSKFEYCEFKNGSIDTRNLIHYTSPFNIHDVDWFEVRHCKIARNHVGDDAMHIAYAKGIVDSCEFTNARSDGLDIDISDVNITNNIFYKSGNDGLDIMTTTMNASNNVFIDMGDKGISVGEWSEANITDSFFLRTLIGTEIKDKSHVVANNLIYVDSKAKAINLYNKNKRYDTGGFLDAKTIYMLGNTKVKADKRSAQKIEHKIEDDLPSLKQFQWYDNIQQTPYKKYLDEVEVKYAH
ncbi:MAG: hypothetical protein GQ531_02055 [Sulfurovum sp.]|nr:hypothetical protein [Sulfurovum sp.]